MDPLLEAESSEDSESEDDFVFGKGVENTAQTPTQRQRKYRLSRVVKNRIDEYIDKKLYESMYYNQHIQHTNKNPYEEKQQHHSQQVFDYSRPYPSYSVPTTSYQFC